MPELPEVETVRRGLLPVMEHATILTAETRRPDLRWPLPENMSARLTGARVERLWRRSKYILADLSSAETLIIHLGMSGRILITQGSATEQPGVFHHAQEVPGKHDHVLWQMSSGAKITYNDARRFGAMDLTPTETVLGHKLLSNLGPEPLGNAFSASYLTEAFARRNSPVKTALLDQRIVAGLGNIYVCEALHRAGISPSAKARDLTEAQINRLTAVIREVLTEAIAAGGSSLRDYRQTDGDLGYFQHNFRVYGRAGESCPTPGCPGQVARLVQSGRSTFYCADCQR